MAKRPHTMFARGKRVRLIFKDGSQVISKFVEKRGDSWVVLESGNYHVTEIRALGIYKLLPSDTKRQVQEWFRERAKAQYIKYFIEDWETAVCGFPHPLSASWVDITKNMGRYSRKGHDDDGCRRYSQTPKAS